MAGKKISPEKRQLLREFEEFVLKFLTDTPVVRVADLEQKVHDEFADRIKAANLYSTLRSGRTEWANLVDWVKARMTDREWSRYFDAGGDKYLAFLPTCGQVNDVELVQFGHAARLRNALIRMVAND